MQDPSPKFTPTARRFFAVAGQQLGGTLLGFLVWVLLARMLMVSEFGEFNAAYGVAIMAGTLANLGLAQYVTVPFRTAIRSGDFSVARGLRRTAPWCVAGSCVLAYLILYAAHLMSSQTSMVRDESFAVVLAMLPLVGIMLYFVATANTYGAPGRAMFLSVSGLQILIVLGLGATWLLDPDDFNMLDAAAVWVGAMMIICIALWRLNLAVEPAQFKHGREMLAWRAWVSGTLPFFLAGSASVMLIQMPFIVLGWIHASGREAAMFAAADRLAQLLAVAGLAGIAMFLPLLADAIQTDDHDYLRRLVRRWMKLVGTANLVGLGILVVFGGRILEIYGPEYRSAYPLLLVTGTSIGFSMTASIALSMVQYAGGGSSVIKTSLLWSVIGIVAMLVLGWAWEAMGVALGQAGAFVGMYLTFILQARSILGGTNSPRRAFEGETDAATSRSGDIPPGD